MKVLPINTIIPENRRTSIDTYNNCQTIAVWTGIGYAFSALALSMGSSEIADTVINSIHDNQLRSGHFWDHWECGHHYTRPMSSWSTLIAASGLKIDFKNKKPSFNTIRRNVTFPLVIPGVLAKVTFTNGKPDINCIYGISDWEITAE